MINQNGKVTKELKEGLGLSELTGYPRRIGEAILPTFETNPDIVGSQICYSATQTVTGDLEGFIPKYTNKRFLLTGFTVTLIKDAACDAATGFLVLRTLLAETGGSVNLINIPIITLTAQEFKMSVTFKNPIKLKENSNFYMTGTFGAGVMLRGVSVFGYWEEEVGN